MNTYIVKLNGSPWFILTAPASRQNQIEQLARAAAAGDNLPADVTAEWRPNVVQAAVRKPARWEIGFTGSRERLR